MNYRILTGVAAAALGLTACAEADTDSATDGAMTSGDTAETADPAAEEMMGADDPLAGDPDVAGADGTLGSDRTMQGKWTTKRMAGAPAALFGTPDTDASFSVRCEGGELVFARGAMAPEGEIDMTLMAGGETKTLAAHSTPDPLPTVTGRLPADDGFAATLAQARHPIAVRIGDRDTTFRMPASAALRGVVSDCRR